MLYFSILLLMLVAASFYARYCYFEYRIGNVIEQMLIQLEDERIIRIVEEDGEHEIYSGSKPYIPSK